MANKKRLLKSNLLIALVAAGLILAVIITNLLISKSNKENQADSDWMPETVSEIVFSDNDVLSSEEENELLINLNQIELVKSTNSSDVFIEITDIKRDSDWVVASYETRSKETNELFGTSACTLLIFKKYNNDWEVYTCGDEKFVDQVDLVPDSLINPETKKNFSNPTDIFVE